jgi:hypothetical protein
MVDFLTRLCSFSSIPSFVNEFFLWVFYDAVGIRDYVVDGSMMLTDELGSIWKGAAVA